MGTSMRTGRYDIAIGIVAIALSAFVSAANAADDLGLFDAQADVGTVSPAGTGRFDKGSGQYRVTSSGQNVWGTHDDFHFVYRKASGDMTLTADITLTGESKGPHRKGGLMIRQGLEPDAAYVDVMVHGDGLIGLQYRTEKGGQTADTKATVKSPATVRLERKGDTFTLYVAPKGESADKPQAFERVGSVKAELKDPVHVGLAVCSHDAKASETAVFSGVSVRGPHSGGD